MLQPIRPDQWGGLSIRVIAVNDSYEPIRLDRRLLVGPNPVTDRIMPLAMEEAAEVEEDNFVELHPWCLYGRERRCPAPKDRPFSYHAYLLIHPARPLRADGPADPTALAVAAELVLEPDSL